MTAKEKANKLFSSYYVMLLKTDSDVSEEITISLLSKQCALIAVDEILNTIEYSSQADELSKISYWEGVKNEIEKL
jgi:hypothetical protein